MKTMPYDTGGEWNNDGYRVSPPVSSVVSPAVSPSGSPRVAPLASLGGDEPTEPGNEEPPQLSVGRWLPVPDDPDPAPGPGLRAAVAGSELLGGGPGGLLAELASPHPATVREHLAHVAAHPLRPTDRWGGAAFTTGHLAVTGPVKATGKILTFAGTALLFAGTRIDWAGDRFSRTAAVIVIALALILIVTAFT